MSVVAPIPRISWEHLVNHAAKYPSHIMSRQSAINFVTGLGVVKHFMGQDWIETHINPFLDEPSYYRLIVTEGSEEMSSIGGQKVVILGEHLFNLQHIKGFDSCIRRLRNGDLEPTMAELKLAAMFYVNDWDFLFVEPVGEKRSDYEASPTAAVIDSQSLKSAEKTTSWGMTPPRK